MDVTVVVVTWNGRHLLPRCLAGLSVQDVPSEVWVVDNGSTDGTAEWLRAEHPQVRLVRSERNLGFAGGNDLALREVTTPYAVLLNNDAVPRPGWLRALLEPMADAQVAAVASKVLFAEPPGVLNSVGGGVDRHGYGYDRGFRAPDDGRLDAPADVFSAPGTAVALRTAALADVGLLDEDFFLYYEDTDLCWRLRLACWRVVVQPSAVVEHLHSATAVSESDLHRFHDARNRLLMLTKNATAGLAVREALRFPLTTLSIALREDRHKAAVRARAYGSYLRLLPRALARRREIGRRAAVPRAEVQRLLG